MPEIPTSIEDCMPGIDSLQSLFPKDLELSLAGAAAAKVDDPDVPAWVKATLDCLTKSVFPSLPAVTSRCGVFRHRCSTLVVGQRRCILH